MSSPTYTGTSPTYPGALAGGGGDIIIEPPAGIDSEAVAAGSPLADHTFSAFTGDTGSINSYSLTKVNVAGSATMTGSGLGAYTIAGDADGECLAARLDALDTGGNVLASQFYVGAIGSATPQWATLLEHDFDAGDTADFDAGGDTTYSVNGETITIVGTANTSAWAITANGMEFTGSSAGETTAALTATDLSAHADYTDDRNMTTFEMHFSVDVDTVSTVHYFSLLITDSVDDSTADGGAMFQVHRNGTGSLGYRVYASITEGGFGASATGTLASGLSGVVFVHLLCKQQGDVQEFYYRVDSSEQAYAADGHGTPTGWTFLRRANRGAVTAAVAKPQSALVLMSRTYAAGSNSAHTLMKARVRHYKDAGVTS